jgi:hypothetical protein
MITGTFHFSTVPSPASSVRRTISGPADAKVAHHLRRRRRAIYRYDPGLQGLCRYRYFDVRGKRSCAQKFMTSPTCRCVEKRKF